MLKIICVNGAPCTGKDTVGEMLLKKYDRSKVLKISEPLDVIARSLLGVNEDIYNVLRNEGKERILSQLGMSISVRQLLINISEELIKPSMGETWLAEQVVNKINAFSQMFDVFIITDSGFQHEFDCIKSLLESRGDRVRLINLQREGHNFDNDSREDVSDGEDTIVIHNDGTLEELEELLQLEIFNV